MSVQVYHREMPDGKMYELRRANGSRWEARREEGADWVSGPSITTTLRRAAGVMGSREFLDAAAAWAKDLRAEGA